MSVALRATTVGLAAVLLLSGCNPTSPSPSGSTPAPTVTASTSPTAPAAPDPTMPSLAGQELLTITATATAGNDAQLNVSMVVYYPVLAASAEGQQIAAYLAFKGDTSPVADPGFIGAHGAIYQLSRITATAVGGTAWPAGSGVLPSLGPGRTDTLVDIPAAAVVGTRLSITGAGSGYGVAALYTADGAQSDPATWADRFTFYGFQDNVAGSTLSGCLIQKTALANSAAPVAKWIDFTCYTGIGD
jgi:hypothetical protein